MKRAGEHALVLGGSMAGLATARVLSDFYDRVTIIERDVLPDGAEHRRGVPQAQHAHGLLARGREILEELFPGYTREVVEAGGASGDLGERLLWWNARGYFAQKPVGLQGLGASRVLLESVVRRRVRALPNVTVRDGVAVSGLVANEGRTRVTGVEIDGGEVAADLVVDATGRGSRSPAWLEGLGYQAPSEDEVRVGICYASRFYRRKPDHLGGATGALVAADEESARGGVLIAQEDDRWVVTLFGYDGDQPPTDEAGYLEFAKSLPTTDIYETLRATEPLTDLVGTKYPASRRKRYEKLSRFPEGYLVIGDAVCSFNPIYGQGMTVALSEALLLRECLEQGGEARLARRFFKGASKFVDIPWSLAASTDLRFESVAGRRSAGVKFVNWYISRLHRAAHRDAQLANTFIRVANLKAPKTAVLSPTAVFRVVRGNLGKGSRAEATPVRSQAETA